MRKRYVFEDTTECGFGTYRNFMTIGHSLGEPEPRLKLVKVESIPDEGEKVTHGHVYESRCVWCGVKKEDPTPPKPESSPLRSEDVPALKPCPFCGGEAHVSYGMGLYFYSCLACDAGTSGKYQSEADARAAWNRRVTR